mgnify:CR=1 FL=1
MTYRIYVLREPGPGAVRYVGITTSSLITRLEQHLHAVCAPNPLDTSYRAHWLRKLLVAWQQPVIELIEETADPTREAYWVSHYQTLGCRLTNGTLGGDGSYKMTTEVRAKISQALTGKQIPPEVRAKMSAAHKGPNCSPETRARMSAATRKRHAAGGFTGLGMSGKKHSPETIAKMKATHRAKAAQRAAKGGGLL